MMVGFMVIEIESFDELKQSSGCGVVLQKDLSEEIFACSVVVEDLEELVKDEVVE